MDTARTRDLDPNLEPNLYSMLVRNENHYRRTTNKGKIIMCARVASCFHVSTVFP